MPELYSKKRMAEGGVPLPFPERSRDAVLRTFEHVMEVRAEPSNQDLALLRKARKYCRVLRFFPGIRRVWLSGSVSMNASDADSDIDLFIETAPGRLWTARILATLYFQILGVRRYGNKVAGRFCLSFFAVDGADFGKIAIENDIYLYEWKRRLVLLAESGHG
jgi:predicted nucleotidyltransferase